MLNLPHPTVNLSARTQFSLMSTLYPSHHLLFALSLPCLLPAENRGDSKGNLLAVVLRALRIELAFTVAIAPKLEDAAGIGLESVVGTGPNLAFIVPKVGRGAFVTVGDDEGTADAEERGESGDGEHGSLHGEMW